MAAWSDVYNRPYGSPHGFRNLNMDGGKEGVLVQGDLRTLEAGTTLNGVPGGPLYDATIGGSS